MKYTTRAICAILFLALTTAQSCPSPCREQKDCPSGTYCTGAKLESGETGYWCIEYGATPELQREQAGWRIKSVTVTVPPVGVTVGRE